MGLGKHQILPLKFARDLSTTRTKKDFFGAKNVLSINSESWLAGMSVCDSHPGCKTRLDIKGLIPPRHFTSCRGRRPQHSREVSDRLFPCSSYEQCCVYEFVTKVGFLRDVYFHDVKRKFETFLLLNVVGFLPHYTRKCSG